MATWTTLTTLLVVCALADADRDWYSGDWQGMTKDTKVTTMKMAKTTTMMGKTTMMPSTTTEPSPEGEWTCDYADETYELFDQLPTGTPCMMCLCLKQFEGCLDDAVCRNITCPSSNWETTCAPVYVGGPDESCCPVGWRCPTRRDKINPATTTEEPSTTMASTTKMTPTTKMQSTTKMAATTKKTSTTTPHHTTTPEAMCKFGRLTMNVGDELADSGVENTVCSCMTPPNLTCVQTLPCP